MDIYNYVADFMNGVLTREQFWVLAKFKYPTHQINFGRKTKNERKVVVNALGREGLKHYYDLAEVYHSENMDKVVCEIVEKYGISEGNYDNVSVATEYMPTHWDIGKVMQRLIYKVAKQSKKGIVDTLIKVYNSWIIPKIDDYSSSMYYENTSYQYASYRAGRALYASYRAGRAL